MQPSSLVFVVVIGLWAVYLTQSWMRRREHLQTARSIERYAEAMRVIERRPAVSAPAARSYAVSPLRAQGATSVTKSAQVSAPRPTRARRGVRVARAVSLVVALVATVALVVLAAMRVLPLWTPAIGLLLLVADLVWLRHAAKANAPRVTLRRTSTRGVRTTERRAGPVAVEAPVEVPVEARPEVEPTVEVIAAPAPVAEVAGPFDVRAFDEAPAPEAEPEPVAAGQWRPVPVPRPTYALKPAAPRATPGPLVIDDEVFAPVEIEDDFLDEPVPLRRAVGG